MFEESRARYVRYVRCMRAIEIDRAGTYYRQRRELEQHHRRDKVDPHRAQGHVGVEPQRGLILLYYLLRPLGSYLTFLRLRKEYGHFRQTPRLIDLLNVAARFSVFSFLFFPVNLLFSQVTTDRCSRKRSFN